MFQFRSLICYGLKWVSIFLSWDFQSPDLFNHRLWTFWGCLFVHCKIIHFPNSEQCLHLWLETLCACEDVVSKWYVLWTALQKPYTDNVISNRPELSMDIKFCHYTIDLYPHRLGIRNLWFLKETRLFSWVIKTRSRDDIWTHIIFDVVSWNLTWEVNDFTILPSKHAISPQKQLTLLNKRILQFGVVIKNKHALRDRKMKFLLFLARKRAVLLYRAWWKTRALVTNLEALDQAPNFSQCGTRVHGQRFPKTGVYTIPLQIFLSQGYVFWTPDWRMLMYVKISVDLQAVLCLWEESSLSLNLFVLF